MTEDCGNPWDIAEIIANTLEDEEKAIQVAQAIADYANANKQDLDTAIGEVVEAICGSALFKCL